MSDEEPSTSAKQQDTPSGKFKYTFHTISKKDGNNKDAGNPDSHGDNPDGNDGNPDGHGDNPDGHDDDNKPESKQTKDSVPESSTSMQNKDNESELTSCTTNNLSSFSNDTQTHLTSKSSTQISWSLNVAKKRKQIEKRSHKGDRSRSSSQSSDSERKEYKSNAKYERKTRSRSSERAVRRKKKKIRKSKDSSHNSSGTDKTGDESDSDRELLSKKKKKNEISDNHKVDDNVELKQKKTRRISGEKKTGKSEDDKKLEKKSKLDKLKKVSEERDFLLKYKESLENRIRKLESKNRKNKRVKKEKFDLSTDTVSSSPYQSTDSETSLSSSEESPSQSQTENRPETKLKELIQSLKATASSESVKEEKSKHKKRKKISEHKLHIKKEEIKKHESDNSSSDDREVKRETSSSDGQDSKNFIKNDIKIKKKEEHSIDDELNQVNDKEDNTKSNEESSKSRDEESNSPKKSLNETVRDRLNFYNRMTETAMEAHTGSDGNTSSDTARKLKRSSTHQPRSYETHRSYEKHRSSSHRYGIRYEPTSSDSPYRTGARHSTSSPNAAHRSSPTAAHRSSPTAAHRSRSCHPASRSSHHMSPVNRISPTPPGSRISPPSPSSRVGPPSPRARSHSQRSPGARSRSSRRSPDSMYREYEHREKSRKRIRFADEEGIRDRSPHSRRSTTDLNTWINEMVNLVNKPLSSSSSAARSCSSSATRSCSPDAVRSPKKLPTPVPTSDGSQVPGPSINPTVCPPTAVALNYPLATSQNINLPASNYLVMPALPSSFHPSYSTTGQLPWPQGPVFNQQQVAAAYVVAPSSATSYPVLQAALAQQPTITAAHQVPAPLPSGGRIHLSGLPVPVAASSSANQSHESGSIAPRDHTIVPENRSSPPQNDLNSEQALSPQVPEEESEPDTIPLKIVAAYDKCLRPVTAGSGKRSSVQEQRSCRNEREESSCTDLRRRRGSISSDQASSISTGQGRQKRRSGELGFGQKKIGIHRDSTSSTRSRTPSGPGSSSCRSQARLSSSDSLTTSESSFASERSSDTLRSSRSSYEKEVAMQRSSRNGFEKEVTVPQSSQKSSEREAAMPRNLRSSFEKHDALHYSRGSYPTAPVVRTKEPVDDPASSSPQLQNLKSLKAKARSLLKSDKKVMAQKILSESYTPVLVDVTEHPTTLTADLKLNNDYGRKVMVRCSVQLAQQLINTFTNSQIKEICQVEMKNNEGANKTRDLVHVEVTLKDMIYAPLVRDKLIEIKVDPRHMKWMGGVDSEVVYRVHNGGLTVEVLNVSTRCLRVASVDSGITTLLFKICIQGRGGFYEKFVSPDDKISDSVLSALDITMLADKTSFSVQGCDIIKDILTVSNMFLFLSLLVENSQAKVVVLVMETWEHIRHLLSLYLKGGKETDLAKKFHMFGVLNNFRMGVESVDYTFEDSGKLVTAQRNIKETFMLRETQTDAYVDQFLRENCVSADFRSLDRLPVSLMNNLCFLALTFSCDSSGIMTIKEVNFVLAHGKEQMYMNQLVCSEQFAASSLTNFKGNMLTEENALLGFMDAVEMICKKKATLVVFNTYLTLPPLLQAVKRYGMEARFYTYFRSVLQFAKFEVGLQSNLKTPRLRIDREDGKETTSLASKTMFDITQENLTSVKFQRAAVPMSEIHFSPNFFHVPILAPNDVTFCSSEVMIVNCRVAATPEQFAEQDLSMLVLAPLTDPEDTFGVSNMELDLTTMMIKFKVTSSCQADTIEKMQKLPNNLFGFIQTSPYPSLIPRIIPHAFYLGGNTSSTDTELIFPMDKAKIKQPLPPSQKTDEKSKRINGEQKRNINVEQESNTNVEQKRNANVEPTRKEPAAYEYRNTELKASAMENPPKERSEMRRKSGEAKTGNGIIQAEPESGRKAETKKIGKRTDSSDITTSEIAITTSDELAMKEDVAADVDAFDLSEDDFDEDRMFDPPEPPQKSSESSKEKGVASQTRKNPTKTQEDPEYEEQGSYEPKFSMMAKARKSVQIDTATKKPLDKVNLDFDEVTSKDEVIVGCSEDIEHILKEEDVFESDDQQDVKEKYTVNKTAFDNPKQSSSNVSTPEKIKNNDPFSVFNSLTICPDFKKLASAYAILKGVSNPEPCDELILSLNVNLELDSLEPMINIVKKDGGHNLEPQYLVPLLQEHYEQFTAEIMDVGLAVELLVWIFKVEKGEDPRRRSSIEQKCSKQTSNSDQLRSAEQSQIHKGKGKNVREEKNDKRRADKKPGSSDRRPVEMVIAPPARSDSPELILERVTTGLGARKTVYQSVSSPEYVISDEEDNVRPQQHKHRVEPQQQQQRRQKDKEVVTLSDSDDEIAVLN